MSLSIISSGNYNIITLSNNRYISAVQPAEFSTGNSYYGTSILNQDNLNWILLNKPIYYICNSNTTTIGGLFSYNTNNNLPVNTDGALTLQISSKKDISFDLYVNGIHLFTCGYGMKIKNMFIIRQKELIIIL